MKVSKSNNEEKGLVFDIQRFSIHDGPGIRTTVFMKGCPLQCLWCSNPESQDPFTNLMVRNINCKGCGACVGVCPEEAITITKEEGRKIDWEKCNQCLRCVAACIYNSLNRCGTYMEVKEVFDEVVKDEDFYKNSGGGVTVSGGEPLLQTEFVYKLLRICKERGLPTALDTTGYAAWEKIEKILPLTDLLLWDIKHLDTREHKRSTGVENEPILENLAKAARSKLSHIWLRIPLIADFNDSEEHLRSIAALGKKIGAEKISLLPYHEGGKSKAEQLGRSYEFSEAKAPSDEHITRLKQMMEQEGVRVAIGN